MLMIRRRVVAFVTCLSLLHLTSVGNDIACATHEPTQPGEPHQMHDGMSMPQSADAADRDHAARHRAPLDAPARTDCCQGMASCSTTVLISTDAAPTSRVQLSERVLGTLSAASTSLVIPPEPPPPKA